MAKKELSRQKKFDTRIDFTPMVDMNMLLITFFMLCTTMLKSQTLQITLPTNEEVKQENQQEAKESEAFTVIIDGTSEMKDLNGQQKLVADPSAAKFYYYEGRLNLEQLNMEETNMKGNAQGTIRYLLVKKNKAAIDLINKEKEKWQRGEINDSVYQERAKVIRNREDLERPIVMIKPTGRASYSDVVAVLDEMQINNISRFQIETLSKEDSTALEKLGVKLPPAPAQ